jgi:indole-3-glycerol phosphate synthase
LIRPDFQPADHARAYEAGGAACLSVLTDAPYFQGQEDYRRRPRRLRPARAAQGLHGRSLASRRSPRHGCRRILIIVAALSDAQMAEIEAAAREHGMDVLVKCTTKPKWSAPRAIAPDRGQQPRSQALRDRHRHDRAPRPLAPEGTLLVAESGINHADLVRLGLWRARSWSAKA